VYAEQTAPLISLYASRGILVEVNGIGTIAEVNDRLMKAISA
jgi:adenylate kinase